MANKKKSVKSINNFPIVDNFTCLIGGTEIRPEWFLFYETAKGPYISIRRTLFTYESSLFELFNNNTHVTIKLFDGLGNPRACYHLTYSFVESEPPVLGQTNNDVFETIRLKGFTCSCYTYKLDLGDKRDRNKRSS